MEMIKAYDTSHKQSLLEDAIQLAEWISKIAETDISRINLLQCNYRQKGLSEDEENVLV